MYVYISPHTDFAKFLCEIFFHKFLGEDFFIQEVFFIQFFSFLCESFFHIFLCTELYVMIGTFFMLVNFYKIYVNSP